MARETVRRLCATGIIPAVKRGGRWRCERGVFLASLRPRLDRCADCREVFPTSTLTYGADGDLGACRGCVNRLRLAAGGGR